MPHGNWHMGDIVIRIEYRGPLKRTISYLQYPAVLCASCRVAVDSDERHVTSDKGDGLSSSIKTLSGSVSPRSVLDMATIRYDTRCYINVRSKANMSQLNLPHATDN